MPYAVAGSVRLYYEVSEVGESVLLLHPVGLDSTCWEAQVRTLSSFRVLRVDLRGHGRSDIPPPPYTLKAFAEDVHLLLDQLRCAPTHVIGLSLGGMVAQVLALEHPGDVRSLVLADTTSTLSPEGRRAMIERGEAAKRGGMASVLDSTLQRWFTPGFMGSSVVEQCRSRLLANDVRGWAATWQAIAEVDTELRLGEIRVPTLVVIGDADLSVPVSRAQAMAERIPGAVLRVLAGAPHMAPLECPELFDPPVVEFLKRLH